MKNLNPKAGLKLITKGYLPIPRFLLIALVKKRGLTPSNLGWFLMFACVADWTSKRHRLGFIRFTQAELAKIWGVHPSAVSKAKKELIALGLLEEIGGNLRVFSYPERFTVSGATKFSKEHLNNEELQDLFSELIEDREIFHHDQADDADFFSVSYKDDLTMNEERLSDKDYEVFEDWKRESS